MRHDANTFEAQATPWNVKATLYVETPEQARAIAARFPKAAKVRASTVSAWVGYLDGVEWEPDLDNAVFGTVGIDAKIAADGVNGGRNETGIKRLATFRRAAERLGYDVVYRPPGTAAQGWLTEDEYEEALGWVS